MLQQLQLITFTMANLFAIGVASTRSVNSISCSNRLPFSSDSVRQRLLRRYGRAEILISMKDKSRRQMTVLRESTFADYYLTYYIDPPFVPLAHVHTCRSPVKNMSAVFLALTAVGGQAVALLKNQSARLDFSMRTAADKVSFYRHARWFYFSCPANSGCCGMHCCTKETEKVQLQFEDYAASLKRDFPYLTSDTVVQFRNKNYSLTEPINTLPDLQKQCEYTLQPEDRIFSLLNYRFVVPENNTVIYFFCRKEQVCCQLGCRERSEITYRMELPFSSFYAFLFSVGLLSVILLTICIIFLF